MREGKKRKKKRGNGAHAASLVDLEGCSADLSSCWFRKIDSVHERAAVEWQQLQIGGAQTVRSSELLFTSRRSIHPSVSTDLTCRIHSTQTLHLSISAFFVALPLPLPDAVYLLLFWDRKQRNQQQYTPVTRLLRSSNQTKERDGRWSTHTYILSICTVHLYVSVDRSMDHSSSSSILSSPSIYGNLKLPIHNSGAQ